MAYLNRLRLHRVRAALLAAEPGSTLISTEALKWGFWHFGEFSRAYKQCFGESPSRTLRREPDSTTAIPARSAQHAGIKGKPTAAENAVTVVDVKSDPTAANTGVELLDLDAVQLQSLPLRVRRVMIRLESAAVVFHSTNLRVRTRTSVGGGFLRRGVPFGPQAHGTINGLPVRPGLLLPPQSRRWKTR